MLSSPFSPKRHPAEFDRAASGLDDPSVYDRLPAHRFHRECRFQKTITHEQDRLFFFCHGLLLFIEGGSRINPLIRLPPFPISPSLLIRCLFLLEYAPEVIRTDRKRGSVSGAYDDMGIPGEVDSSDSLRMEGNRRSYIRRQGLAVNLRRVRPCPATYRVILPDLELSIDSQVPRSAHMGIAVLEPQTLSSRRLPSDAEVKQAIEVTPAVYISGVEMDVKTLIGFEVIRTSRPRLISQTVGVIRAPGSHQRTAVVGFAVDVIAKLSHGVIGRGAQVHGSPGSEIRVQGSIGSLGQESRARDRNHGFRSGTNVIKVHRHGPASPRGLQQREAGGEFGDLHVILVGCHGNPRQGNEGNQSQKYLFHGPPLSQDPGQKPVLPLLVKLEAHFGDILMLVAVKDVGLDVHAQPGQRRSLEVADFEVLDIQANPVTGDPRQVAQAVIGEKLMLHQHHLATGVLILGHRDPVGLLVRPGLQLLPAEAVDDLDDFRRTKQDFLLGAIPEDRPQEILKLRLRKVGVILDVRGYPLYDSTSRPLGMGSTGVLRALAEPQGKLYALLVLDELLCHLGVFVLACKLLRPDLGPRKPERIAEDLQVIELGRALSGDDISPRRALLIRVPDDPQLIIGRSCRSDRFPECSRDRHGG